MKDFDEYVNETLQRCFKDADEETELLFGQNETLPDDELELVLSSHLSLPERLQALTKLRASKGVLPN